MEAAPDADPAPKARKKQPCCTTAKFAAILCPVMILGLTGYVTWVVLVLLCVNHLIVPQLDVGQGLGLLIPGIVLLFLMLLTYFRVVVMVRMRRDLIPLGRSETSATTISREKTNSSADERSQDQSGLSSQHLDQDAVLNGHLKAPPGLDDWFNRDFFECTPLGLPKWCMYCRNWKDDRAHHSRDLGRCVLREDHFCPWVGGMVAEKSFKFFIQFLAYALLFVLFGLIVLAVNTHKVRTKTGARSVNVNWYVALGIYALFTLFVSTVFIKATFFLALPNKTNVEMEYGHSSQYHVAARLPVNAPVPATASHVVLYPFNFNDPTVDHCRYAIFQLPQGLNPWDCGLRRNMQMTLGSNLLDILLPIHNSEYTYPRRDARKSRYQFSPYVRGLVQPT